MINEISFSHSHYSNTLGLSLRVGKVEIWLRKEYIKLIMTMCEGSLCNLSQISGEV